MKIFIAISAIHFQVCCQILTLVSDPLGNLCLPSGREERMALNGGESELDGSVTLKKSHHEKHPETENHSQLRVIMQ